MQGGAPVLDGCSVTTMTVAVHPRQWSGSERVVLLLLHFIYRSGAMALMDLDAGYAVVTVWNL